MSSRFSTKSRDFHMATLLAREQAEAFRTESRAAAVQLAWRSEFTSATRIGWRIAALDREVRRSAAASDLPSPPDELPPVDEGGLAFREASPGSTEILFDLYGFVRDVALSDPVEIVLKAVALAAGLRAVWGFVMRRDPLDRMSGRDVLAVIRSYEEARSAPDDAEPLGNPPPRSGARTRVAILVENEDGSRRCRLRRDGLAKGASAARVAVPARQLALWRLLGISQVKHAPMWRLIHNEPMDSVTESRSDILSAKDRSERMSLIRARDTRPERTVRSMLHRAGFRYSLHARDLAGRPDLVFRRRRRVIYVHGCFWHSHAGCKKNRPPKSRLDYWGPKLAANRARDTANLDALRQRGWQALVVWECETERDPAVLLERLKLFLGSS